MNAWYYQYFWYVILIPLICICWSVIHNCLMMLCNDIIRLFLYTIHDQLKEAMKMKVKYREKKKISMTTAPDDERFWYPHWVRHQPITNAHP